MKKIVNILFYVFLIPLLLLSGCTSIGDKSASMSTIYVATTILSLLVFAGYLYFIKKKELWFIVLFSSVSIVNLGYFLLSVATTLDFALTANRISYLGSVFLPLSMTMIIMNVSGLNYKKKFPAILAVISLVVFLVAASPGYLDIYYKSVTLEQVNGVSVLNKVYGPWHCLYLFYLIGCFIIMLSSIIHAAARKKLESAAHVVILIVAVLVNICVWLLEQLIKIDFEFLSVSYIITELFLISVYLMIQHQETLVASLTEKLNASGNRAAHKTAADSSEFLEQCEFIVQQLHTLTASERSIYNLYLDGKSTKEVLSELNISENTLKFHNKNLYGKLGVSSRKQLIECAKAIAASGSK